MSMTALSECDESFWGTRKPEGGLWNPQILQLVSEVRGLVNCSLTLYRALRFFLFFFESHRLSGHCNRGIK